MITLLREEYPELQIGEPIDKLSATLSHLELVNTVEEILKIRDFISTTETYETDPQSRHLRLNRQFQIEGIRNETDFYRIVQTKVRVDNALDFDNFPLSTMFDESLLRREQFVTYAHFSLKHQFTEVELIHAVKTLKSKISPDHNVLIFFITHKVTEYQSEPIDKYEKRILELNSQLRGIIKINVIVRTLETYYTDVNNYSKTYFYLSPKENNVYLLNKILTARRTLVEMARVRRYQGEPGYIYYDNFSGRFGHFKMNLQARLDLARATGASNAFVSLEYQNYFDVPLCTPNRLYSQKKPAVYMHFILLPNVIDYHEYCKAREHQFRTQLGIDGNQLLHVILVVNKKQGTKNMIEKIGDRLHPKFSIDIVLLDNILFNPLDNVNQPKFRLIKKKTSEYTAIVEHYGSIDDIPRINARDPVNKFYGGEQNDIYEIIRPGAIKINDEKDTMLHIDVAYRIVKG